MLHLLIPKTTTHCEFIYLKTLKVNSKTIFEMGFRNGCWTLMNCEK